MATHPSSATPEPAGLLTRLGGRVRSLRQRHGMTRRSLALHSSVSERHLAELEQGRGNISIALLGRVANALQIELSHLLRAEDSQSPEQSLLEELIRTLSPQEQKVALRMLYQRFTPPAGGKRRVALIGLRGAGKTTLGKLLAEQLSLPFVRLVRVIEGLAGMSVSEIFSLSGEVGYRRLEEQALMETLRGGEGCVIDTGGSIVAAPDVLDLLLTSCFVIWVKTYPEQYMQRVIEQGDLRPMLNHPNAMANLRRLLAEREPSYSRAHAIIDTSDKSVDDSLAEMLATLPEGVRAARQSSGAVG